MSEQPLLNPLPRNATIAELYDPAMRITEQAAADEYFKRLIDRQVALFHAIPAEAEEIERANLAYFAGYCGPETRRRVEKLFHCEHPIFGSIERNGQPSAQTAVLLGIAAAATGKLVKWDGGEGGMNASLSSPVGRGNF